MENPEFFFTQLEFNIQVFKDLLQPGKQPVSWKQQSEKWSLVEIVCHLRDEEKEDFRQRVQYVLERPEKAFPSIDPVLWVTERKYISQNYPDVVKEFMDERHASLKWLKTLNNAQWDNVHHHPKLGPMSARFILTNWVAHDYLHFRQISKLKYDYLSFISGERLSYAGTW